MIYWFLGFKESWFIGFLVFGSKVSKFPGFEKQKIFVPSYKISITCFLRDLDLISNIFKIIFDESAGFSAPAFF